MFGSGDRTTTAPSNAAGPAKGGSTATKTGGGGKDAKGGPPVHVGGKSVPAKPGCAGPR
jgi:hypothetical protein